MTCDRQRARNFEYSYIISLLVLLLLTTSHLQNNSQRNKTKHTHHHHHPPISSFDRTERKNGSRRYRLHTLNFRYIRLGANLLEIKGMVRCIASHVYQKRKKGKRGEKNSKLGIDIFPFFFSSFLSFFPSSLGSSGGAFSTFRYFQVGRRDVLSTKPTSFPNTYPHTYQPRPT